MFPRSSAFQNLELHWEHVFCLWRSKIHCKFRSLKRDPRMSLQYLFVKMHALEHKKQESQDHFAIYFFRSRCKQHGELLQTSSSTASAATTSSTTSRRETWKCIFIISKGPRYSNLSVGVKEAQDITWSTHRKLGETKPKRRRTWYKCLLYTTTHARLRTALWVVSSPVKIQDGAEVGEFWAKNRCRNTSCGH